MKYLILIFLLSISVKASEYAKGEVLVKIPGRFDLQKNMQFLAEKKLKLIEVLSKPLNIVLAKTDLEVKEQISVIRKSKGRWVAQPNHFLKLRSFDTAADPYSDRQWNLSLGQDGGVSALNFPVLNHSGKDISGQDVVIAVVDAGFQVDHLDLKDNIWINTSEIPDNKMDDDGNGYVDDVYGWNAYKDNGKIKSDTHGTHVLGIVGAVGNNKLGITGVSGKIKMMLVMGATEKTSTLIKAYSYILEQKKLWLETHGKKGANIVATNSSFGVDDGDCKQGEFPLWNEMYNKLGEVGILSAVATVNDNINVDVKGDVPSGCQSPYLISATNTNKKNQKFALSGFGKKTIHLAAPGEDIFSTFPRNSYAYLTGTSMSTPHVTGAIGLLHMYASQNFNQLYLNKPADAALKLKEIILNSVDPLASLKDLTITGGRLNVENAMTKIINY